MDSLSLKLSESLNLDSEAIDSLYDALEFDSGSIPDCESCSGDSNSVDIHVHPAPPEEEKRVCHIFRVATRENLLPSPLPLPSAVIAGELGMQAFECTRCSLVYCTMEAFKAHFALSKLHHPCGHCGADFKDLRSYGNHIRKVLLSDTMHPARRGPASSTPEAVVPGSKRARALELGLDDDAASEREAKATRVRRENILNAQLRARSGTMALLRILVLCPLCPEMFLSQDDLRDHLEGAPHPGYHTFWCPGCDRCVCMRMDLVMRNCLDCEILKFAVVREERERPPTSDSSAPAVDSSTGETGEALI